MCVISGETFASPKFLQPVLPLRMLKSKPSSIGRDLNWYKFRPDLCIICLRGSFAGCWSAHKNLRESSPFLHPQRTKNPSRHHEEHRGRRRTDPVFQREKPQGQLQSVTVLKLFPNSALKLTRSEIAPCSW